jgi:hypothetical protein
MNLSALLFIGLVTSVYCTTVLPSVQTQHQAHRRTKHRKHKHHRPASTAAKNAQNVPGVSTATKAGEFNGDLRDIPPGKPIRQGSPELKDPKIKPKPYIPPTVKKPDEEELN